MRLALVDTPVAITAISASQLESKATINIGDLDRASPNVLITNQNSAASAANLSIPGVTFADIEKSFGPTVAVVIDGVFVGTSMIRSCMDCRSGICRYTFASEEVIV